MNELDQKEILKWSLSLALFIILVYVFFISSELRSLVKASEDKLIQAKNRIQGSGGAGSERFRKLNQQMQDLNQQWKSLLGSEFKAQKGTDAIDFLTMLFNRYNLRLIDESPASEQAGKNQLPAALKTIDSRLRSKHRVTNQLWEVNVSGSYLNMFQALQELASAEKFLIPISLEMEKASGSQPWHNWTLLVWI